MSAIVASLAAGIVFGIALAAPPGPMNAIIAEESVLRGWTAGFKAGVGAMLADVLFFALAAAGAVAVVVRYPTVQSGLYVAGGALMVYFAIGAWQGAREAASFTTDIETDATGFQKAFALSITNPYQIGFWLTVGVGLIKEGTLDVFAHVPAVGNALAGSLIVETGSPALLLGFFGGIAVWIVAYPAMLARVGERVDRFAPIIALLSGVVLAGFGALFLALGITGLR
ncbi:LysE family transporter [Halobacteria archaeon AArc-curdl1]|uniref:LysE family transporter n=1 Tax=Natronosalvus hydrolyticus TaxID=2979988 RepID=A0AAP2Z623_9EURY|nr:LysE family transporter [Halobacteria archaeon AArc-curdl1]